MHALLRGGGEDRSRGLTTIRSAGRGRPVIHAASRDHLRPTLDRARRAVPRPDEGQRAGPGAGVRGSRAAVREQCLHERPRRRRLRGGVRGVRAGAATASAWRAASTRSGSRCWPSGSSRGDEVIVPAMHVRGDVRGGDTGSAAFPSSSTSARRDYCIDTSAVADAIDPTDAGHRARSSLRPDRGHASARATRGRAGVSRDRGRLPGARRRARRCRRRVGRATAAAFSFYPGKNLGAIGDAGARDDDDAASRRRVRALREHGQRAKYDSAMPGLHRPAGHDPGARPLAKLAAPRRLERASAAPPRPRTPRRWTASATCGCRAVPDGSEPRLAPLRRSGRPTRWRSPRTSRDARIGTGRHYPEPPHLTPRLRLARLSARGRSRWRRRSRASAFRCRSSPG